MRVVKSFWPAAGRRASLGAVNREYQEASLSLARLRGMMIPVVGSAASIGILAFFAYGAALLLRGPAQGGISEGDFFAFSLALNRMTWPMVAGFLMSILQRGRVSFARPKKSRGSSRGQRRSGDARPATARRPVHQRPVVCVWRSQGARQRQLSLPAGESLAIVGRTGSGKTTLAMLLARLLPTPESAVFIDDHDVCSLKLSAVRNVIGYAQQDAFLFSTTVARNIGFMLSDPDSPEAMEQIKQAAQAAQIYSELQDLPDKLDTIVGERRGSSGGQKRADSAGARSLWQPRLLILDDPLSAVDAKTEAAILEALQTRISGGKAASASTPARSSEGSDERSLLLITHRVAAAARCQRILVLDRAALSRAAATTSSCAWAASTPASPANRSESELEELGQSDVPETPHAAKNPSSQPSQDAQP